MFYRLGLIGHPTAHSLSPAIHTEALKHFALEGSYELIDVAPEALAQRVSSLSAEGFSGLNVTVPHKQASFALLANTSNEAKQLGCVNCIKISDGEMFGHNTDLGGFVESICSHLPTTRNFACVLGAGGAARAAIFGLWRLGFKHIAIAARNNSQALLLSSQVHAHIADIELSHEAIDALNFSDQAPEVVVNSTSIGLSNEAAPPWAEPLFKSLPASSLFYDLVYRKNLEPTTLMREAGKQKIKCFDGRGMLINQAILSFEYWTGLSCPRKVMEKAL